MRLDARSKSYAGEREHHRESSYENTLNDVRRLRSTRLDKHLSSSFRKARTSRIMDGPEGTSVRPGSAGTESGAANQRSGLHIEEDRLDEGTADTMFGNQDALTLDDIHGCRGGAGSGAETEQFSRQGLFRSPATEPNFRPGDQGGYVGRDESRPGGRERTLATTGRKEVTFQSCQDWNIL